MSFLRRERFTVVYTTSGGEDFVLGATGPCVPTDQTIRGAVLHVLCDESTGNSVFVIAEIVGGQPLRATIVHLGNLSQPLRGPQLAAIKKFGAIDTLLLPIGGPALDPAAAVQVIAQLRPGRAVIVLYQGEQAKKQFAARQAGVADLADSHVTIGCTGAADRRKPPELLFLAPPAP